MKKRIVLIITVICLLSASLFAMVACVDNKIFYELPYDIEGVLSINAQNEDMTYHYEGGKGTYFNKGEKITITIQIANEYTMGTFKLLLNDIELTFTATDDNNYVSSEVVVEDELKFTYSGETKKIEETVE